MIQLEKKENIAILRLNNGVTSPINLNLLNLLEERIGQIKKSMGDEYQGLLLAGGEKFFSIGFDLPNLIHLDRNEFSHFWTTFNRLFFDLYTLPIPTVCAMRGHAIAGGAVLALCTDFRVGAEGKKRIGLNEIKLGIPIPFATDLVLRQIVGDRTATNIIYSGDFFNMETMLNSGLIDEVQPMEEVEKRGLEMRLPLAQNCGPAFAGIKENRTAAIKHTYDQYRAEKDRQFMDMWYSDSVQTKLAEAAKSF